MTTIETEEISFIAGLRAAGCARDELIGRRSGKDIVQVGAHADGTPIRWIFSEITPESFRWTGEALNPDGRTWRLEAEFHGRRIASEGER
jgi:hypothetical protein